MRSPGTMCEEERRSQQGCCGRWGGLWKDRDERSSPGPLRVNRPHSCPGGSPFCLTSHLAFSRPIPFQALVRGPATQRHLTQPSHVKNQSRTLLGSLATWTIISRLFSPFTPETLSQACCVSFLSLLQQITTQMYYLSVPWAFVVILSSPR